MTKSTILIESETRQLLRKIGRKEQTYDALIRELVAIAKECGEKENLSGSGSETPTRQVLNLHSERNNQEESVSK